MRSAAPAVLQPPDFRYLSVHGSGRWTSIAFHAMLVGCVITTQYLLLNPRTTLIAGGLLCFPGYLFLAFREARGASLRFTPLSYYFLWYSVGLGASPLYVADILQERGSIPFSVAQVSAESIAVAYVFFLIGSLTLHIGLQMARPSCGGTGMVGSPGRRISGVLLLIMWVMGLLALWHPEWIAPFGAPGRLLRWSAISAVVVLALTEPAKLRLSHAEHMVLLALGTAGLIVVNTMSFSKAYIMFSFFPLLWLFVVREQLHRWLPILGLLLIGAYLGVVAPVVTRARYTSLGPGESPAARLASGLKERFTSGERIPETTEGKQRGGDFLMRQFDPVALGFLVGEVERNGLQQGRTMRYAAYAFIPRLLWPDKPTVTRGAWFAYYIGFAKSPKSATMSLGITATGELYWNFGVPGVMLGMLIIGLLLGGLWRIAGEDPRSDPLRMMLFVTLLFTMPNMSEAVTTVVAIVVMFLTYKSVLGVINLLRAVGRREYARISA